MSVAHPVTISLASGLGLSNSTLPSWEPFDAGINRGEVDVWRVNLDQHTPAAWALALTVEDFHRADRFVHQRDRIHFLQARFCLRTLLAGYANLAPYDLEFRFNDHGKPALPPAHHLRFNHSRSGNLAAIAVGRQRALGIDIERITPPDDLRRLAQQVFSDEECKSFAALLDIELPLAFLTCWTREESYLKALGVGLTLDPRSVTAGLCPSPLHIEDKLQPGTVSVETIGVDAGAVLSLAVCGGPRDHNSVVRILHLHPSVTLER